MSSTENLIAVNGCLHGDFSKLLSLISPSTRLLILLGDLQLLSTKQDLSTCSIPYKYTYNGNVQKISDYHRLLKNDPMDELAQKFNRINCVIGIGGNHENMGLLEKFPYGGFVNENFFFMGHCNIISYNGLRIAGISGIFKSEDLYRDREYGFKQIERGDYNWWRRNKVSSYHVRFFELLPLLLYEDCVDFVISHDWPQNVFHNNDPQLEERLFKIKPFFKRDVLSGKLGSPLYDIVMENLRPSNWFAAHLHIRYQTTVEFEDGDSTSFLALDKLIPNRYRDGLSQFEFPASEEELDQLNLGDCGIELDIEFIKIQHWCYKNESRIKGLLNTGGHDFKADVAKIKQLFALEKSAITLTAPLLKPYFSEDRSDYTTEYLNRNLNVI